MFFWGKMESNFGTIPGACVSFELDGGEVVETLLVHLPCMKIRVSR